MYSPISISRFYIQLLKSNYICILEKKNMFGLSNFAINMFKFCSVGFNFSNIFYLVNTLQVSLPAHNNLSSKKL